MTLAEILELEDSEVQDEFYSRGWTDGLPIVPPTPERVGAMLAVVGDQDPDLLIGYLPVRGRGVTLEHAAINAVMAGCVPEYFPVVLAALEAMFDTAFNLHSVLTSTGGPALCAVVSGPIAAEIGMNAQHNMLGPGNRANATVGRALRLIAINVLGAHPGDSDASSISHPGKYTFCFAEDPPPAPWQPLHVQLGYGPTDTTVTVFPSDAPRQISQVQSRSPEVLLKTVASAIRTPFTVYVGRGGQGLVILGPEHAGFCIEPGWTQQRVREFLYEHSRITPAELRANGNMVPEDDPFFPLGADGKLPATASPEDIYLVTAGGAGAGWSAWVPNWIPPAFGTRASTRRVRPVGEPLPDCGPDGCIVPSTPAN